MDDVSIPANWLYLMSDWVTTFDSEVLTLCEIKGSSLLDLIAMLGEVSSQMLKAMIYWNFVANMIW